MFKMPKQQLARAQTLLGVQNRPNSREHEEFQDWLTNNQGFLAGSCFGANLSKSEYRKAITLVLGSSLPILMFALSYKLTLLPLIILPTIIAFYTLLKRAFNRAENFERDYPAFLLSLASSIRTGLDPLSAMMESEILFESESEIRKELLRFKLAIEHGKTEQEAIHEFGASIRHPDVQLFRTGYILARKEGSSLAECLQRLAKVTRQRQSFRRKVKSAVAMQRMSAFGIGGCSILICIIQTFGNPKILTDAFAHPVGQRLMITGALLILGGLSWMLRMTRSTL